MSPKGIFVTLEGGEGGGKTTQIARLADWLRRRGLDVVTTREPGGSPGAEEIRKLLVTGAGDRWDGMTEALLMSAARRDHVEKTIRPALAAGRWVICDRFFDSTIAYQGYARGLPIPALEALTRIAIGDLVPDLTLILDLPAEIGLQRAGARAGGETRFEALGQEFHRALRQGFHDIAAHAPARCRIIDAAQTLDQVTQDLQAALEPWLPR